MRARLLGTCLGGLLVLIGTAYAETAWTLWERPVDLSTGEPRGEWRTRQSFEAERWCRGEMTRAINQTLGATENKPKSKTRERAPTIAEFQCLPEGKDPRPHRAK